MLDSSKLFELSEHMKSLTADLRRFQKLSDRLSEMTFDNSTQKKRDKASAELNWLAMEIDQKKLSAHVLAVEAGIADMRDDAFYGEREYNPSGWHRYTFNLRRPVA